MLVTILNPYHILSQNHIVRYALNSACFNELIDQICEPESYINPAYFSAAAKVLTWNYYFSISLADATKTAWIFQMQISKQPEHNLKVPDFLVYFCHVLILNLKLYCHVFLNFIVMYFYTLALNFIVIYLKFNFKLYIC